MQADDAQVAALLQAELVRLQRASSHEALGLSRGASKSQIRAAFLRDTKRFHPNRFARRSRAVTRLANEVFLLIKDAYYDLAGASTGSNKGPPLSSPSPMRSPVSVTREAAAQRRTAGYRTGPVRAITDADSVHSVSARGTGPRQSIAEQSTGRHPTGPQRVVNVQAGAPRSRQASSPGIQVPRAPAGDAQVAEGLVAALQLAEQKHWREAMTVLQRLYQSHPRDRRIQAYAHFIRGREYESVGSLDKARAEYERALGIEPTLDAAQRALGKLGPHGTPPRR